MASAETKSSPSRDQWVYGCVLVLIVAVLVGGGVGTLAGWLGDSWVWGLVGGVGSVAVAVAGLAVIGSLLPPTPNEAEQDGENLWLWKDSRGRLRRQAHHRENRLHGPDVRWDGHGRKVSEGTHLDGKKEGPWTTWDGQGRLRSRVEWKADAKHGLATWWHPDGRLWIEATYRHGEMNGPFREWRRDGQPRCRLTFFRGAPLEPGWHRFRDPAEIGHPVWGRVLFWVSWLFWGLIAALFVTVVAKAVGLGVGLLALTATIVIHEVGHLFAAWVCGIPIKRFQVGLGPALVRFWLGCTRFQIAPLPFWGYVAAYHMKPSELAYYQAAREASRSGSPPPTEPADGAGEEKLPTMELATRPRRLLFYSGGVLFNLLAAGLFLGMHFALPPAPLGLPRAVLEAELEDSPDTVGGLELIGLDIMENGWRTALLPIGLLNVILAVFNLLPVPPLDGFRCLLVLIGLVIRRDVPRQYLWPLNMLGCLILLVLLGLNAVAMLTELLQVLFRGDAGTR